LPSAVSPTEDWKAETAEAVPEPYCPSAVVAKPRSVRRYCTATTSAPLEPVWSTG
jgi:hypothetical protein